MHEESCWEILHDNHKNIFSYPFSLQFLRDFIIVGLAKLHLKHVVLHVHSGGYGNFYKMQNTIIRLLIRFMLIKSDSIIILG